MLCWAREMSPGTGQESHHTQDPPAPHASGPKQPLQSIPFPAALLPACWLNLEIKLPWTPNAKALPKPHRGQRRIPNPCNRQTVSGFSRGDGLKEGDLVLLSTGSDLPSAPPAPLSASQLPSLVLLPKVTQQPQHALGERATFRSSTHFN